jgi:hypothetical protein
VGAICAELPLEWLHVVETLPVQLDVESAISALELLFGEPAAFWKLS